VYAIVAGGGKVGFYLARELLEQGHEVLVIESSGERSEFIANELGNVVLKGNADEASTLAEAGAERADVVVAVTGDDEDNLVICQVAKMRFGAQRTIARINDPRNEGLFRLLGIDATMNATRVMLYVLEQEIPSANLIPLSHLRDTDAEIVEIVLPAGSPAGGKTLTTLPLPEDCSIPALIRDGSTIFPNAATTLAPGDVIVAVIRRNNIPSLQKLLLPG
jgi:trk system potassium uptake protein TrkA